MTATLGIETMTHAMTTEEDTMTATDTKAAPKTNTEKETTMAMAVDLPTAAIIVIGTMTDIVIGMMTATMTGIGTENQGVLAIPMERTEAEGISMLLK
jgi:hypothetical protein